MDGGHRIFLKPFVVNYVTHTIRPRGLTLCPETACHLTEHSASELLYFSRLLEQVKEIQGEVIECGVWKGFSFTEWALLLYEAPMRRHLWGFDSFQGYPTSREDGAPAGTFKDTSVLHVIARLQQAGLTQDYVRNHITLVPGFFDHTLSRYHGDIAIVHLDCNLYQSTLTCLQQLWPRLMTGGIVAFNEYDRSEDSIRCPGSQKAADEFFATQHAIRFRDRLIGKTYFQKSVS